MISEIVRASSLGELLLKASKSKSKVVIPDQQSAIEIRDNLANAINQELSNVREQNVRNSINNSNMDTFLF